VFNEVSASEKSRNSLNSLQSDRTSLPSKKWGVCEEVERITSMLGYKPLSKEETVGRKQFFTLSTWLLRHALVAFKFIQTDGVSF
jgi:hypothetical protein